MNITSVNNFDAAVKQLDSIKGDVTADQLSGLTELFSTQIWNTSDAKGTTATLERQIKELEALIDEIQSEIDTLYDQQKAANDEMNGLVNDLNEESYQASKQADKNLKQQQDLVSSATDEAYRKYMKGEIEKDEIPMYIAEALAKSNGPGGAKMQAHLTSMDAKGQKITSISNKIANILDSINEFTAKLKTTQTSLDLMKQLKAAVPEHKERADIQDTLERPYFTPSQEALGDKLIDKFKVANDGQWADGNQGTTLLNQALQGSGVVDKAKLDAMSPEEKAQAVEDCDLSKYSALELMYMSGMDATHAAYAIGHVFRGAGVGYNEKNGALITPQGHDGIAAIFKELRDQYTTLWGGKIEAGSENDKGVKGGADPFSWRDGDTTFTLTIDRNGDGRFNGTEEFLGANGGVDEIKAADTDGDGKLTAAEMDEAGIFIMENNQAMKAGGTYGFNGAAESGVDFLDIDSFRQIDGIKSEDLNGNTRKAEFNISVNGETLTGKQSENQDAYNQTFYGHTFGEAISFGLDPEEVQKALTEAAQPKDYTELEQEITDATVEDAQDIIAADKQNLDGKIAQYNAERATATTDATNNAPAQEENAENKENEETPAVTATSGNTTETNTNTTTTGTANNKIIEEV